jgi:hypothetical protein
VNGVNNEVRFVDMWAPNGPYFLKMGLVVTIVNHGIEIQ